MIIKISPVRLLIFCLLVILFPLIQHQWLNLYLFDKNNFSFYKILYYLSGLIFPTLVCLVSLGKFSVYKFRNNIIKRNNNVGGRVLLIITLISLFTLATLISIYIFFNLKLFFNQIINTDKYLIDLGITNLILFSAIITILLFFKKTKLLIKKIILVNFFMISLIIWYSKINNIIFNNLFIFDNFLKFENYNFINIFFILSIEIFYYLWSYISDGSHLSDWSIPFPNKVILSPFFRIIFFYLMVIIYYAILSY